MHRSDSLSLLLHFAAVCDPQTRQAREAANSTSTLHHTATYGASVNYIDFLECGCCLYPHISVADIRGTCHGGYICVHPCDIIRICRLGVRWKFHVGSWSRADMGRDSRVIY